MGTNGHQDGRFEATSQTSTAAAPTSVMTLPRDDEPGSDVDRPVDSQILTDPRGTRNAAEPHPAFPEPEKPRRHWLRWIVIGLVAAAIVGAGLAWGVPALREVLETVSTDDAFVEGHVTNVSPRIDDVVTEVLVDQDDRVEAGALLVRLDRQPFEVALAQAEAALKVARANLVQARAQVKSQIALARSEYYRRKNAQERLRQQIATLRAQVATLKARQSDRWLAEIDQRRISHLVQRGSATQAELDQRNNTLKNADERVKEAWEAIQETRSALGLEPNYQDPLDIPKDLEQHQSTVQTAVSEIASSLAQVGIPFDPKDADQARAFEDFLRPEGDKSAGEGLEGVIEQAPAVQVARSSVDRAASQLDDARLRLSWTEVRSEIDGYVQDRQVNPGNQVEPGQTLISIRPTYVWITANYKETQIHDLRIGQPVDLHVDAYPRRVFKARVAGFSPGTGLSESLLPPENATGNYVKVTQRLPVRIELVEPNPDDMPLFVGLSVVPHVRYKERPTGPGAGQRLHVYGRLNPPDLGGGPAGMRPENRDRADRRVRP
jgi:membrane fusion protein (multidrug efflux system)